MALAVQMAVVVGVVAVAGIKKNTSAETNV